MKGLGEVPRLAGLQPLYIVRPLFYLRYGSNAGKAAELMKPVVANLSEDGIIAISLYFGSLPPQQGSLPLPQDAADSAKIQGAISIH